VASCAVWTSVLEREAYCIRGAWPSSRNIGPKRDIGTTGESQGIDEFNESTQRYAILDRAAAIVDVFLQGSNGVDLIVGMRAKNPDLPIVAISGMTTLDFVAESPALSDVVCLQKPFRPNELLAAIDAARARNARGGEAVA
jgi:DNA-binding response OmpR family regulator